MKSLFQPYCIQSSPINVFLIFVWLFFGCTKKEIVTPKKKSESQTLKMNINGEGWTSTSHNSRDREALHGQLTGIGIQGVFTSMYTVKARKKLDSHSETFEIQIYDLEKPGRYVISGNDDIYDTFGTYVVFIKRFSPADDDFIMYAVDPSKKPFEVIITKYDIPYGSIVPTVGGTFSGVLYNMKNNQDSIVVDQGSFEVRF